MIETPETAQFRRLMQLLQQEGVVAFPDSGTLLFLRREGSIPARDKDIDLAVLPDAVPRLLAMSRTLKSAGYHVKVNRYRGLTYTISLKPLRVAVGPLPVSVHVYFQDEDWLVSPQARQSRSLLGRPRIGHAFAGSEGRSIGRDTVRLRCASALRRITGPIDRALLVEFWPLNRFFEGFVWRIPAHLILPLRSEEFRGLTIHMPYDVEGYLAARYGDWRSPRADWVFWVHDGLITQQHPRDLVERLTRSGAVE